MTDVPNNLLRNLSRKFPNTCPAEFLNYPSPLRLVAQKPAWFAHCVGFAYLVLILKANWKGGWPPDSSCARGVVPVLWVKLLCLRKLVYRYLGGAQRGERDWRGRSL